jgi:hypothetical protein
MISTVQGMLGADTDCHVAVAVRGVSRIVAVRSGKRYGKRWAGMVAQTANRGLLGRAP